MRSAAEEWRGCTAVSLGFVVGPALGGILSRRDLHFTARYGHFMIDSFSVPFFAAAALGLLTLFAAIRWLPESLAARAPHAVREKAQMDWRKLARNLGPLLGLALVGQFGLAIFEATFALYAQAKFNYGPAEVGAAFVVCGLVMSIFQVGAVGFLEGRISEIYQIGTGFGLMGTSLALMVMARTTFSVFALVGLLALGTAFVSPNLAALISETRWQAPSRRGTRRPKCSQQSRSGEWALVGRRAVHLAGERSVPSDRGIVSDGCFGHCVERGAQQDATGVVRGCRG
jgi:MFS transporter, DHA1 family, multidrug resistance protein